MYNAIRIIAGLTKPVYLGICFGLICIWSPNAFGQIYSTQVWAQTQLPAADLEVKQMSYASADCTMYFLVYNKGNAWSKPTNIWSGYQSNTGSKYRAISVTGMAAGAYTWIAQPMWQTSSLGQKTCAMNGVTSVKSYANARYAYKYSNGVYSIGTLVTTGSYAPTGWSIAEPGTTEANKTNNELTLPITSIPKYFVTFSYP